MPGKHPNIPTICLDRDWHTLANERQLTLAGEYTGKRGLRHLHLRLDRPTEGRARHAPQRGSTDRDAPTLVRVRDSDVWTLFHSYASTFRCGRSGARCSTGAASWWSPPRRPFSGGSSTNCWCERKGHRLEPDPIGIPSARRWRTSAAAPLEPMALRYVIFGGEALDSEPARLVRAARDRPRSINMYGITETTVHVTYCPINDGRAPTPTGQPIGVPISGTQHLRPRQPRAAGAGRCSR